MHWVEACCGMDPKQVWKRRRKAESSSAPQESNLSLGTAIPISTWHATFTSTGLSENVHNKKRGISWLAKRLSVWNLVFRCTVPFNNVYFQTPCFTNCLVKWQWIRRGNQLSPVRDSKHYTFNLTCCFMPRIPTRILISCRPAHTCSTNSVNSRPYGVERFATNCRGVCGKVRFVWRTNGGADLGRDNRCPGQNWRRTVPFLPQCLKDYRLSNINYLSDAECMSVSLIWLTVTTPTTISFLKQQTYWTWTLPEPLRAHAKGKNKKASSKYAT
jgi:hypothetical protein